MTEDLTEMREKIDDMHSGMLKAMLRLNELPAALLKRYFVIKKLLDRVDGRLTPADLVRIAMDVGLNPETLRFGPMGYDRETPSTIKEFNNLAEAAAKPKPPEPEDDEIDPANPDYGDADEPETVVDLTEDIGEPDDDGDEPDYPGELVEQPDPTVDDEPLYPVGTKVRIFDEGNIHEGEVTAVDGESYTVVADGETHEVSEEDIDA